MSTTFDLERPAWPAPAATYTPIRSGVAAAAYIAEQLRDLPLPAVAVEDGDDGPVVRLLCDTVDTAVRAAVRFGLNEQNSGIGSTSRRAARLAVRILTRRGGTR